MTSLSAAPAPRALNRSGAGNRIWWAVLSGLCVILLAPLLIVDVPPLVDYPNHLARVFVLASLPDDRILARFYAPHWSIIPNLALDIIAPPLIHILPVHVVGRLLIALAVLLPTLGTVAYNSALRARPSQIVPKPGRMLHQQGQWWSLGVGLIAYNSCLLYGFLNFEISVGLALLLAAAWLRWRETRPWRAITLAIIGAPALFACHLMGLVFFGLLIGGAELYQTYQVRNGGLARAILTRGLVLVLIIAIPAGLYAMSDLQDLGGDAQFLPFDAKLSQLLTTFVNYNWPLDMATAATAFSVPVLCLLPRWGRVPGPAAVSVVLLLIAFLAMPYAWKGTYLLDTRFAIMLGFMVFAGFMPIALPVRIRAVVTILVTVLFIARMALLATAWASHRTDLADLRTVLAPVQPGQAIYVAHADASEAPAYWAANPHWRKLSDDMRTDVHLGALALIEHRAYWPFEFDNPSQQPMETRNPYRALAGRVGNLPNRAAVGSADLCGFDYVLLLEADAVPDLPADRFRLLVRSGFVALYTITKCKVSP